MRYLLLFFPLILACSRERIPRKIPLPDALNEVSGFYYGGADSLWWHNDSGHEPRLYRTDLEGNLLEDIHLAQIRNRDWEALAFDEQGHLYIGDFGNNANARRDLRIYRYHLGSGAIDSILFSYPDQERFPPPPEAANFDMEAFFWYRDSLHLFSKNRLQYGNDYTKHYVLPAAPGGYTAELRDSVYLKKRVVTGAAISPDGQAVVLVAYWFKPLFGFIPLTRTSVFLLEAYPDGRFLQGTMQKIRVPKGLAPTQYEAIDFVDPARVLLASERTVLFRQKARRIKLPRRERPARP